MNGCPSRVAGGRTDRCGLYAWPPRCTPDRCSVVDAVAAEVISGRPLGRLLAQRT